MRKEKILIVDDEFDDAEKMKHILELEGYTLEIATNASKAMELLSEKNFDLVLLDINMPNYSGHSLFAKIKKCCPKLKIIYVTLMPKKEIPKDEVDWVIQKPFTQETLSTAVRKLLTDEAVDA